MDKEEEIKEDKPVEEMSLEDKENLYQEMTASPTEKEEPQEEEETSNNEEGKEEYTLKNVKKELDNMQKLLSRQGTELGYYRKLESMRAELESKNKVQNVEPEEDEEFYVNPHKASEKIAENVFNRYQQKNKEQQAQLDHTRSIVHSHFPDFDKNIDVICNRMKDFLVNEPDGEQYITSFKQDPYSRNPWILLFAADSIKSKNKISELEEKLKGVQKSNGSLVKNFKKFNGQRPTVTGASGYGDGGLGVSLSNRQIEDIGDLKKLEKLYKQAMSQLTKGGN